MWLVTSYRRSATCRDCTNTSACSARCEPSNAVNGLFHSLKCGAGRIVRPNEWRISCEGARGSRRATSRQYQARRLPQIERALASCMRWLDRSTLPTVTFAHHAGPSSKSRSSDLIRIRQASAHSSFAKGAKFHPTFTARVPAHCGQPQG